MSENAALQCKIVLIGESGVGKTSIINRYISDTFSPVLTATPGASFATKTVFLKEYNQSIKFEIWIQQDKKNIELWQKFSIKMQLFVFWFMI